MPKRHSESNSQRLALSVMASVNRLLCFSHGHQFTEADPYLPKRRTPSKAKLRRKKPASACVCKRCGLVVQGRMPELCEASAKHLLNPKSCDCTVCGKRWRDIFNDLDQYEWLPL